jgi:APA family basic amino acid/polyamine antiporter
MLLAEAEGDNRLRRVLGPWGLTSLGVGAIIGTGIFVLTGIAAHDKTGPALMLSFVVAGSCCIFAALCYAEFASMVPVAGSAFTYAYATMGELFAWIIGWDLLLEYTVASAAVSHGWSHYFQNFISIFGWEWPKLIGFAPFDYDPAIGKFISTGSILDLPAIFAAFVVTVILVKGIRESATINNVMVGVKLVVVLMVIVVGAFYIDPRNWHPFAPYGYAGFSFFGHTVWGQTGAGGEPLGMLAGAAIMFFAYIGFDAVSTHAEEAKRPKKDVPFGIIMSLILCTVLYILVSMVLTGMVPSDQIDIDAPVAAAFERAGLGWAHFLIALGALTGISSVLLVMMLSQPRVMLAMARDGLVSEKFFGAVHPRFRTPWKGTIVNGIAVAILGGLLPLRVLAELVNIGTLLAFIMVCFAVLIMRYRHPEAERPFKSPLFPLIPILGILTSLLLMFALPVENWFRLGVWLAAGLLIYFIYGRKHSYLRVGRPEEPLS